jgi:RHS repeat-associated protein
VARKLEIGSIKPPVAVNRPVEWLAMPAAAKTAPTNPANPIATPPRGSNPSFACSIRSPLIPNSTNAGVFVCSRKTGSSTGLAIQSRIRFRLNGVKHYRSTGKERDSESNLDYFGARYFSGAQGRFTSVDPIWITKERMLDPQRLNLYAYGRNNPLRFIDPDGMDITLGRCASGSTEDCYNQVLAGLEKEDRSHVHLVQGDGKNGFKKGQFGVTVDADYESESGSFQTLQKLAGDHSATARIDVLNPDDKFDVRLIVAIDAGKETLSNMSMTPGNPNDPKSNSFVGYTFFPQGKGVPGPFSTGNFTDVVVNTVSPDGIASTIHHELRHVLLGDFGRAAPYGAHGTGRVDQSTTEAEKEAAKNSKVK